MDGACFYLRILPAALKKGDRLSGKKPNNEYRWDHVSCLLLVLNHKTDSGLNHRLKLWIKPAADVGGAPAAEMAVVVAADNYSVTKSEASEGTPLSATRRHGNPCDIRCDRFCTNERSAFDGSRSIVGHRERAQRHSYMYTCTRKRVHSCVHIANVHTQWRMRRI